MILLSLFSAALADIPPGPFYREDCTVEKKEQEGTTCVACGSSHGAGSDSDQACEDEYAGTNYAYVCQTYGASVWTEVWCDGPPAEGCGCVSSGPGGVGGLGWIVGVGVLGLVRRRHHVA